MNECPPAVFALGRIVASSDELEPAMPRRRRSSPGPYLLHLELLRERISDPNRFPYTVPAIRHLEKLVFHPKVTFLIGENGTGKSTLLEAIAVAYGLNPEGGG